MSKVASSYNIYRSAFKNYPQCVRAIQMGSFYEFVGKDAGIANDILGFKIVQRKVPEIQMAGFPIKGSYEQSIESILKRRLRLAIIPQCGIDSKTNLMTRKLDKVISPGLVSLHTDLNFGPICSMVVSNQKVEFLVVDFETKIAEKIIVDKNPKDMIDFLAKKMPSELIVDSKLLCGAISLCGDELSSQMTVEQELGFRGPFNAVNNILKYSSEDKVVQRVVKFVQDKLNAVVTPISADNFKDQNEFSAENGLRNYLRWTLPNASENDVKSFFHSKKSAGRMYIPYYSQDALNLPDIIKLIDTTKTRQGYGDLKLRITKPFVDYNDIICKQQEVNVFKSIKAGKNGAIFTIQTFLSGLNSLKLNRFLSICTSGKKHDLTKWLTTFVNYNYNLNNLNNYLKKDLLNNHVTTEKETVDNWVKSISALKINLTPELLNDFDLNGNIRKSTTNQVLQDFCSKYSDCISSINDFIFDLGKDGMFVTFYDSEEPTEYLKANLTPNEMVSKEKKFKYKIISKSDKKIIFDQYRSLYNEYLDIKHKIDSFKSELMHQVKEKIVANRSEVAELEQIISDIDVAICLSNIAESTPENYTWTTPFVSETNSGHIMKDALHPLLFLSCQKSFQDLVPNDNKNSNVIQTISGPNMAGKSTFLKTVAVFQILAQIGADVPGSSFSFYPVESILTRIGTSDNFLEGKSTFEIEALEAIDIMRHANSKSLILIDEFGRGTSYADGYVVGKVLLETLQSSGAKTYFATHIHALCAYVEKLSARNEHFRVDATISNDGEVIFDQKLKEGICNNSFGIEIAKNLGFQIDGKLLSLRNLLNKEVYSWSSRNK
eukprot:NODE_19_length_47148_cov_1.447810.p2 type:complete len:832 gc:universal NODE_19_length_47148_cov_1.447810:4160-1665(-)